jgi:hypothetical protein
VEPALAAARRALRDLDAEQVPSDLRRVAGHSGALPPPLASSLLRGLDRYDWLRAKALDAWPEADAESSDQSVALGTVFLERPPGWVERIAAAVAAAVTSGVAQAEEGRAAHIARLERAEAEAKRRLREERGRAESEQERLLSERDEARAALRSMRETEGRSDSAARRRAEEAEQRVSAAEAELTAVHAELVGLRERLVEERKRRAIAEHAAAEAAPARAWVAGDDPEALAVHLDDVARMARPLAVTAPLEGAAPEPLRLPGRVAPDGRAAIDWLLERRDATTVIVDGYNVGFALAGSGEPAAARRRLGVAVAPLPRLAAGPLRVVVVYDSSIEAEQGEAPEQSGRVTTRFAPPGRSADEEIVGLAGSQAGAVVVVSGDRAVREGAEALGAVALWSRALAEWATRR